MTIIILYKNHIFLSTLLLQCQNHFIMKLSMKEIDRFGITAGLAFWGGQTWRRNDVIIKRILVNSGPSEFGTRSIGEFGTKWIRDQVISGPEVGEFGTNFWWIRDQFLVNSGPKFLSIFFTKIAYLNFYFRNSTKSFICSSIIVCLKTCLHVIIGSIKHLLKPNMFVWSLSFHPWTTAAIKINCTWSLSIVCLKLIKPINMLLKPVVLFLIILCVQKQRMFKEYL